VLGRARCSALPFARFSGFVLKDNASRLPFLDLLRALASQAIVWHHLAFYGPLSDSAHEVAASLIDGLVQHARLAVQVFFVISGYLTALGLSGREPARLRDFFRLSPRATDASVCLTWEPWHSRCAPTKWHANG
jgi:hypothetical protein